MGNLRQSDLQKALDLDAPDWRSWPEGEVAAWLKARKIRNARGLWLDARGVAELKRSLTKAVESRQAATEQRFTDDVAGLKVRLLALLNELDGTVAAGRLEKLVGEYEWIGLTLCEDRFAQHPELHRGHDMAAARLRKHGRIVLGSHF